MELKEAIKKRKSVREYEDKSVSEEKLLKILESARLAPSASNRQKWKFIVVREANIRRQLAQAAGGQVHVATAPIVIAAVSLMPEYLMQCGVPAYAVDLAIAVDHITLAAVDEGLGTCWIGAFSQEKARTALKVPSEYLIVALLTLGFSKQPENMKVRKSMNEILCYEMFHE